MIFNFIYIYFNLSGSFCPVHPGWRFAANLRARAKQKEGRGIKKMVGNLSLRGCKKVPSPNWGKPV
jgi:hypothetical protein